MKAFAYMTGLRKRDEPFKALAHSLKARPVEGDTSYQGGLSLFWGFHDAYQKNIVKCMREGLPFLHLDHSYFKRGYEHARFRVNFGHFHQTKLLDVPGDRSELARKRLEPWKTGGGHVVVIVPSERICMVLGELQGRVIKPKDWCRETEAELKKHTDRPIVRKEKGGGMREAVAGAHAVVSLSSVAEVEAAVMGVPVFTSQDSPACQIAEHDFSKIETPIYPDRERWINTLSYSQFQVSEMISGAAASILKDLYGLFDSAHV